MVLLAIGIAVTRPAHPVRADIGNAELRDLQAKGARLIDVRSAGEFAMGHIAGSENVPNEQLPQTAASWDRQRAVVVYCATGARSLIAAEWLAKNGFAKVYNLKQGVVAYDGQLSKDLTPAAGLVKTNGKPVLIDFYSDS
jgi:rhodanese-related sulfurtransferase